MKGDISLAGFLLTAEEWQSFEPSAREQLLVAAARRDDGCVGAPNAGTYSERTQDQEPTRS